MCIGIFYIFLICHGATHWCVTAVFLQPRSRNLHNHHCFKAMWISPHSTHTCITAPWSSQAYLKIKGFRCCMHQIFFFFKSVMGRCLLLPCIGHPWVTVPTELHLLFHRTPSSRSTSPDVFPVMSSSTCLLHFAPYFSKKLSSSVSIHLLHTSFEAMSIQIYLEISLLIAGGLS